MYYYIPKVVHFAENFFFFYVAACVAAERRMTDAAGEASHMPAQVVDLHQRRGNKSFLKKKNKKRCKPNQTCE